MGLTKDELDELRAFKENPDDDNIRIKEIIKKELYEDRKIIHVLNNKTLDEDCPDEYIWKNIFPCYIIPGVITDVENYICFETELSETSSRNKIMKYGHIIFYVLCDEKNIIDKETGLSRHDLLAALIKKRFNWRNCFGQQIHVVDEKSSVVDNDYALRTLVFEMVTTNSILNTDHGKTTVINNLAVK